MFVVVVLAAASAAAVADLFLCHHGQRSMQCRHVYAGEFSGISQVRGKRVCVCDWMSSLPTSRASTSKFVKHVQVRGN